MNNNQKQTLNKVIEFASQDQSILALILCGSLAQGTETDRSDLDLFVVVTDERFAEEQKTKNYFWGSDFDSDEFNVEVDGKIIPKDFLKKVWRFGNESIQNTLSGSRVIYSRDPEIEALLANGFSIQNNKTENMKKFYALMKSARYSADENLDNLLFLNQCIYNTIFYACRLVLTHNNILYPCVKNLNKAISHCEELPPDFIRQMDEVLKTYSFDKMVEFYHCVDDYFKDCHFDNRLRKGYVLENEWFWYFDRFPYAEI